MKEPLSKNLGFGFTARLDPDGVLHIVEEYTTYDAFDEPVNGFAELTLPAQAGRALLKLLHSPSGRKYIGARMLQQ